QEAHVWKEPFDQPDGILTAGEQRGAGQTDLHNGERTHAADGPDSQQARQARESRDEEGKGQYPVEQRPTPQSARSLCRARAVVWQGASAARCRQIAARARTVSVVAPARCVSFATKSRCPFECGTDPWIPSR